jgi:flagellar biosynthesis chaperone FliJ
MSNSSKALTLISEHQDGIQKITSILNQTEKSYSEGKITDEEYGILKSRCIESINEQQSYINRLQNVVTTQPKTGSIWPTLIGLAIGIYGMLWLIKMFKG